MYKILPAYPIETCIHRAPKGMNKNVHRNICYSPKLERTPMSACSRMEKQMRGSSYNGIPHSSVSEPPPDATIWNNFTNGILSKGTHSQKTLILWKSTCITFKAGESPRSDSLQGEVGRWCLGDPMGASGERVIFHFSAWEVAPLGCSLRFCILF